MKLFLHHNPTPLLPPGFFFPSSLTLKHTLTHTHTHKHTQTQTPSLRRELATDLFTFPKVNGQRVDFCYAYDFRMGPNNNAAYIGCGDQAANEFCKMSGYEKVCWRLYGCVCVETHTLFLCIFATYSQAHLYNNSHWK